MSRHSVDKSAWSKMTIFEQMGNIGSEVGRAVSAKKRGKDKWMRSAYYRGIDLFNITAQQWAKSNPSRLRELLYARDQFTKYIEDGEEDPTLEQYFFQFALVARKGK